MNSTIPTDLNTISLPYGEINYSVERLHADDLERSHIRGELLAIKEQYGITKQTVVEVGCGLGSNLALFRSDNKVVGIEGLRAAVMVARSRGLEVYEGELQSGISLASGSVDWILCLDVLEHLESPLRLMMEMGRVLRPGGRLVVNVPNHFDLSGRIKLLVGHNLDVHDFFPDFHEWDNPHLRFFTHKGICELLGVTGFVIVDDRSPRFWSFPKGRVLERLGFGPSLRSLAKLNPGLFARGLFLIGQKQ